MRPLPGRANLARPLHLELGLARAVETGTYLGNGTRLLASVFDAVITVELAPILAARARRNLADLPSVTVREGHSADVLPELVDAAIPTYWFLDGHWSGGETAGASDNCPVARELEIIAGGHPDDVIVIDDARYFLAPPPTPYDAGQWPRLMEIIDLVRRPRPDAHVTVLADQIVVVPARAAGVVDRYGQQLNAGELDSFLAVLRSSCRDLAAVSRSAIVRAPAARNVLRRLRGSRVQQSG